MQTRGEQTEFPDSVNKIYPNIYTKSHKGHKAKGRLGKHNETFIGDTKHAIEILVKNKYSKSVTAEINICF